MEVIYELDVMMPRDITVRWWTIVGDILSMRTRCCVIQVFDAVCGWWTTRVVIYPKHFVYSVIFSSTLEFRSTVWWWWRTLMIIWYVLPVESLTSNDNTLSKSLLAKFEKKMVTRGSKTISKETLTYRVCNLTLVLVYLTDEWLSTLNLHSWSLKPFMVHYEISKSAGLWRV